MHARGMCACLWMRFKACKEEEDKMLRSQMSVGYDTSVDDRPAINIMIANCPGYFWTVTSCRQLISRDFLLLGRCARLQISRL